MSGLSSMYMTALPSWLPDSILNEFPCIYFHISLLRSSSFLKSSADRESDFSFLLILCLSARKDLSWLSCSTSERKCMVIGNYLRPHLSNKKGRRQNSQALPTQSLYFVHVLSIGGHLEVLGQYHPIGYSFL